MSKRQPVSHLVGVCKQQQYRIAFICILILTVSSSTVPAQQQIALDTYAIFQQSCLICHGPNGAYKETLLMEHDILIKEGTVIPGNPDASLLYDRVIGTPGSGPQMPLGQPPLSPQAIDTIRNWILAGAPDWTAPAPTDRRLISPSEMLNSIETHLMSLPSFDRAFARYFTLTHLYNAGEPPSILQEYRKGLNKLVNSLSWGSAVTNPEPIDSQGTIFYIDLRHYEWDVNDAWTQIEGAYPYHIRFKAPTQTTLKAQLERLQREMNSNIPSVHADWFIANASLPPLYHDLLSLPSTDRELETRLEVDVLRNLQNAPGVRVWRAGTNDSGVSVNNRVLERHLSRYGAYWKSYDFAGSVGAQNIFTHPLSFTHDGGEVIFNLPNGLQGYYITTAVGSRLDAAPISIVSNPAASDPTVRNGLSCLGCHIEGMNTFEDEVRSVIEANTNPAYDKAQALRLYVERSEMDALLQEDMDTYKEALEATGGAVDDIEPISRFHEVFQGAVDAAYAAAVVGLEMETFQEKIRENVGLQNAGLLVLDSPNGSMKRDAWTSNFPAIIYALDFPDEQVDSPSQPDQPPGSVVRIPDPNLRAAIAEELSKSPNAPITVEEMEGLRELRVHGRGIRDLIGLQFATNLRRLGLKDNQVSDLSPIAGLIQLRDLWLENTLVSDLSPVRGLENLTELGLDDTLVSDLSPVRGLKNLTRLWFNRTQVSNLSPIAGLVKLRYLDFTDADVSDLSPVAGLINLETLAFEANNVSNLSPLAGLTNLKRLWTKSNFISDVSPLSGLTKLEFLQACCGDISDITPLVDLIGLKELHLNGNKVSDVSPIAGLTRLTRLNLDGNNISDISPLARLTNLKWLDLRRNNLISDVSPLARLTNLNRLQLAENKISDVLPLAGLTNLKWLGIHDNEIFDMSPLDKLRENTKIIWFNNPAFPEGPPSIEGPWLWIILPYHGPEERDLLSEVSGGAVTETEIATHSAIEGQPLGDDVWTLRGLPPTGGQNIREMLGEREESFFWDNMLYGTVSIYSSQQQNTTMYFGNHNGFKVWLNGTLIYESLYYHDSHGYTDFLPVTLKQGLNVLLVATRAIYNNYLGFEEGTEYTVANTGVRYMLSPETIHRDETFTLDIHARNVLDLAGWQFDIVFDPNILEAVDVTEGGFLKTGAATFFQGGSIDNSSGQITGLAAARLSTQGVSGTGTLLKARFKAKASGESEVTLRNLQFVSLGGDTIDAIAHGIRITVEEGLTMGDINRDGVVTIVDLVLVAQKLNQTVSADDPADINGDGVVNIFDLAIVAQAIGSTTAPAAPPLIPPSRSEDPDKSGQAGGEGKIDPAIIEAWIAQARLEDDGSLAFKQGIENLERLLASLIPDETALLRNYPNPFNPETWIPYQLAESAEVTLTIYDMNGEIVRRLEVGYKAAGMYRSRSRAAYWDGRNGLGESLASGVYFYTLTAGEFTATRRMLILK